MSKYNTYYKKDQERLKYKFDKFEIIEKNYSQAFQDLFVLSILNGKINGTYVEIGGDHPISINNFFLSKRREKGLISTNNIFSKRSKVFL